jgi:hypothetical protein
MGDRTACAATKIEVIMLCLFSRCRSHLSKEDARLALVLLFVSSSFLAPAQESVADPAPGTRTGFTINVQVITKSEFAGGGVGLQHQRSYNDEHGIDIPVTIGQDGSFQGSGSGSDSGTADLTARGINGDSKFGNTLSIFASGTIEAGDCSAIPCTASIIHLTLSGMTSQQNTIAHIRAGNMNRTYGDVTPGKSGTVIVDLPAAVGGKIEQVLFSNTITTSIMLVTITDETIVPPNDPQKPPPQQRPPGLPLGPPDGAGDDGGSNSGGAGSSSSASGGKSGSGAGADSSSIGIVIPGLENGIPPATSLQSAVVIHIDEVIHTADAIPLNSFQTPAIISINEAIHVGDATSPSPSVVINLNETVHVGDSNAPSPAALINLSESLHVADGSATTRSTDIILAETVHVGDASTSSAAAPPPKLQNPKIGHP